MKNNNFATFTTSEYYLAVTLLSLKENLQAVEKQTGSNRAVFIFSPSPTIAKNVEKFRQGKLLIEPQSLFAQHKSLKNRLYDGY
jgi:hypothetical protein